MVVEFKYVPYKKDIFDPSFMSKKSNRWNDKLPHLSRTRKWL